MRLGPAVLLALTGVAVAACSSPSTQKVTAGRSPAAGSATTSSRPDRVTAVSQVPGVPTTVVDGPAPARAAAAAVLLFAQAPLAVVSDGVADDDRAAGVLAVQLGVPMLLTGQPMDGAMQMLGTTSAVTFGSVTLPGSVTAVPAPSAAASASTPPSGPSASAAASGSAAAPATDDPPPVPADLSSTTTGDGVQLGSLHTAPPAVQKRVLTTVPPDDADSFAAAATARAAGTTVVLGEPRSPDNRTAMAGRGQDPLVVLGSSLGPADEARYVVAAAAAPGLPGGSALITEHRYVGLYGLPDAASLGALGAQDTAGTAAREAALVTSYDGLSTPSAEGVYDLITTGAAQSAGPDGTFSTPYAFDRLTPLLDAAHQAGDYTVLDLQPGTANLLDQAKSVQSLLMRPDVGLALDPEWKLQPGDTPLQQVGHVDVAEINSVVTWLADFTRTNNLPQKLLLVHQFQLQEIRDRASLDATRPELQLIIQMDGQGSQPVKDNTYATVTASPPAGVLFGWKNFYDEDSPTLTPQQTMALQPTPWFVSYQ